MVQRKPYVIHSRMLKAKINLISKNISEYEIGKELHDG
jgi:hypothetical protein